MKCGVSPHLHDLGGRAPQYQRRAVAQLVEGRRHPVGKQGQRRRLHQGVRWRPRPLLALLGIRTATISAGCMITTVLGRA